MLLVLAMLRHAHKSPSPCLTTPHRRSNLKRTPCTTMICKHLLGSTSKTVNLSRRKRLVFKYIYKSSPFIGSYRKALPARWCTLYAISTPKTKSNQNMKPNSIQLSMMHVYVLPNVCVCEYRYHRNPHLVATQWGGFCIVWFIEITLEGTS